MEVGAKTLYRSLRAFDESHEDWLQLWPGHGAGSSCGKGISAVPHSTLGYERRFNWAFKARDEADFVKHVLEGQPDPPTYFATMKRMNKEGPAILGSRTLPGRLDDHSLTSILAGGGLIIDTRPAAEFAAGLVPGTINLPMNSAFVTWAGWLLPYDRDLYLVLGDGASTRLPEIVRALSLIGLDRIAGYFGSTAVKSVGQPLGHIRQLTPSELASMRGPETPLVVDVRNDAEWKDGHLLSSLHIPLGQLLKRLDELPKDQPLVTQCRAGGRSAIAASLLHRAGFANVSNLVGGIDAWTAAGLPTTEKG
jgi:hydroxyacylglutathione hydrolase